MSPRFVLGRENVPCVAEVVNRSHKADCTDFTYLLTFSLKVHFVVYGHKDVIKAVTSCSTHKIDQQETDG